MGNYFPDLWRDLLHTVEDTWDLGGDESVVFRSTQLSEVNWNNLIENVQQSRDNGFSPPYAIIQVGAATPALGWGISNSAKSVPVWCYYIASKEGAENSIAFEVEARLYELGYVFESGAYAKDNSGFQVVEECTFDATESNPANLAFTKASVPLFAGVLSVNLLVGETVVSQ